jgi:release factor glutamine methyltransferase
MSNPDGHITWRELMANTAEVVNDAPMARWLCEHASGLEAEEFIAELDELVNARSGIHLDSMIRRVLDGEPVQYVMGRWAFRYLDLMVDQRVLIPRPETELMVDVVLRHVGASKGPFMMADLGTGSGAVGLSLLHELPLNSATVWMTDISTDAIDVARANAAGIGRPAAGARFEVGSWWEALPSDVAGLFDVVVSNPPYIARGDGEVESSVNDWEPHSALFSGDDGLDDIRVVTADAPQWLRSGGLLVVEMGYTQAAAVSSLMSAAGFVDVTVHPDLAGHDRFVSGVKP